MRTFKFRAWHKELKEMVDFSFDDIGIRCAEGSLKFQKKDDVCIDDDDLIIMQYLGEDCKDATGKAICEGDVLKIASDTNNDAFKGYVVFKEGAFMIYRNIQFENGEELGSFVHISWSAYKIIGNIYQNLEMARKRYWKMFVDKNCKGEVMLASYYKNEEDKPCGT
jgi:uncharacterized phage protein (TIGR01671 family)